MTEMVLKKVPDLAESAKLRHPGVFDESFNLETSPVRQLHQLDSAKC